MRDVRGVDDKRAGITDVGHVAEQSGTVDDTADTVGAAIHLEAQDLPHTAREILAYKFVLRCVTETGIVDLGRMRGTGQMFGYALSRNHLLTDSLGQRLQSNERKVGIEWTLHSTERTQVLDANAFDKRRLAEFLGKTMPFSSAVIADDLLTCSKLRESAVRPTVRYQ